MGDSRYPGSRVVGAMGVTDACDRDEDEVLDGKEDDTGMRV